MNLQVDEAGFKNWQNKRKTNTEIFHCVQDDDPKGPLRLRIDEEAVTYAADGDEVLRIGGVVFDVTA